VLPHFVSAASIDFLRSIGKIYSVIGVIVILFIALIGYLIYLDRKITRLEKQNFNDE